MHRKDFIRKFGYLAAALPASTYLFNSCAGLYYASFVEEDGALRIPKSEFLQDKGGKQIEREMVVVHNRSMGYPIGVFRTPDGGYKASLMRCTHRGCELSIAGSTYSCPCHGSEFDRSGKVLEGPAEENLRSFETTGDNENIYVHVS